MEVSRLIRGQNEANIKVVIIWLSTIDWRIEIIYKSTGPGIILYLFCPSSLLSSSILPFSLLFPYQSCYHSPYLSSSPFPHPAFFFHLRLPLTEEGARKETKAGGRTKEWDGKREPGGRDGIRPKGWKDVRREEGGRMRDVEKEVGVREQEGGWGQWRS